VILSFHASGSPNVIAGFGPLRYERPTARRATMLTRSTDSSQVSHSWLEHQSLEHIKRALRVTLTWTAPAISYARKRSSVTFAMECFARHLERLMAIEEEDGYMRMVADAKPNKAKHITELRSDHTRFRHLVTKLSDELNGLDDCQDAEFQQTCCDIEQLLNEVDEHDRAEVRLLQDAMLLDEGVGD
jgi:hypothetical protein